MTLISRLILFMSLLFTAPALAQASASQNIDNTFPSFLPKYFAPVVALETDNLHQQSHISNKNVDNYIYINKSKTIRLMIENYSCSKASCNVIVENFAKYFNKKIDKTSITFKDVTIKGFRADLSSDTEINAAFVFLLPNGVLFWNYTTRSKFTPQIEARFEQLKFLVNRLRYDQAKGLGNVEQGRWAPEFHELAKRLLAEGKVDEGLSVLRTVIEGAPENYEAQLDFANVTSDQALRRNSARAVFDNAEDPDLAARASAILNLKEPAIANIPVLPARETGLQLILIPLEPCDMRLVQDAATAFEKITGIPTRIFRLPKVWEWGKPDRVPDQRLLQQMLAQQLGPTTDFTGWNLDRYVAEMDRLARDKDPLQQYFLQQFVAKVTKKPGQYSIDERLSRFVSLLREYRSPDARTAYVGVTGANIYSGDTNYVFSMWQGPVGSGASILSYAMMTAKISGEPIESRRRLVARLAKEMVPASLKQFNIPRPADPTDPYSYSGSLERLDQKTLNLSPSTREALDSFRSLTSSR